MSIPKAAIPLFDDAHGALAGAARRLAAAGLVATSGLLHRLALRLLERPSVAAAPWPQLEFHADPDGPDGALYLEGEWVGNLPGVRRL